MSVIEPEQERRAQASHVSGWPRPQTTHHGGAPPGCTYGHTGRGQGKAQVQLMNNLQIHMACELYVSSFQHWA